jgi:hypothetical protein
VGERSPPQDLQRVHRGRALAAAVVEEHDVAVALQHAGDDRLRDLLARLETPIFAVDVGAHEEVPVLQREPQGGHLDGVRRIHGDRVGRTEERRALAGEPLDEPLRGRQLGRRFARRERLQAGVREGVVADEVALVRHALHELG